MRSIQALTFKALFPLGAVLVLGLVFYPQIVDSILFTPHPAIVFIIFGLMALGALLLIPAIFESLHKRALCSRRGSARR